MQKRKGLNYMRKLLMFLLVFSLAAAGSFKTAIAKNKKVPAVKSISLKIGKKKVTKKTYPMKLGEKKKIKVSISPAKGKNVIQFTTGNKKVALVSKKGMVTARKVGTAKIKVTVRKKGGRLQKKGTWVKIKVAKDAAQKDKTTSGTEESPETSTTDKTSPPSTNVTPKPEKPTPQPPAIPEPGEAEQGKNLVVYFSCTGTTKRIAEYIQEITGADIYCIEPEEPYTEEDLNYGDSTARATREQNDPAARPAIAGKVENMSQYQNVVIAYPIWWGQAPKIISTFLESYDFSGKTIVPVCTSHSSGIGSSAANLHALADGTVTWYEGVRFSSETSKEEVAQWLQDSGIQELFVR